MMRINKNKRIGNVIFVVEGKKSEPKLIRDVFQKIFGFDVYQTNKNEDLKGDKPFTFCAKDLSMLKFIPDLIEIGVTSLKIEGRMKNPEYVATPIGLLAVGASAGYIFFRRRKNELFAEDNNDIKVDDVEI